MYIIVGVHFTITLLCLVELIRTRVWRELSKFNYTDIKSVIDGASIGGTAIAERARKLHKERQSWWSGDPGDRVVGEISIKLKIEGKDIMLVGVEAEDMEVPENSQVWKKKATTHGIPVRTLVV